MTKGITILCGSLNTGHSTTNKNYLSGSCFFTILLRYCVET